MNEEINSIKKKIDGCIIQEQANDHKLNQMKGMQQKLNNQEA